jgi:hypothetical protein
VLLQFARGTDASTEGGRVVEAIDRAYLASAMEKLGLPGADSELNHAADLLRKSTAATKSLSANLDWCADAAYRHDIDKILRSMSH